MGGERNREGQDNGELESAHRLGTS
jgi:hypothetical protein